MRGIRLLQLSVSVLPFLSYGSPLPAAAVVEPAVVAGPCTITSVLDVVNGRPSDGSFQHLQGITLSFQVRFTTIAEYHTTGSSSNDHRTLVLTGPVELTVTGDPTGYLDAHFAPGLQGVSARIELNYNTFFHSETLYAISINGVDVDGEWFSIEIRDGDITAPLDGDNYPEFANFSTQGSVVYLRRFIPGAFTDFASGTMDVTFVRNDAVGAGLESFGGIKLRFQSPSAGASR